MFGLIRLVLGIVIFAIVIKIAKRKLSLLLVFCISVLITTVLSFVPFENVFISFSSPAKAYNYYYNYTNKEIKLAVPGQKSDFVIGGENDTNVYLIVPKTNGHWKLGLGKDTNMISRKFVNGYSIHVYRYKNTSEYYVSISNTNGGDFEIIDKYGSVFFSTSSENAALNTTYYTYYAYIPNYQSQYMFIIDGTEIQI